MSKIKIAQCLPWYEGMDRDCTADALAFQHYLGRLQERAWWVSDYNPNTDWGHLPPLAPDIPDAEFPKELIGTEFEFGISAQVGCSLPGMARERAVDFALDWGADYIFFYDDDMKFSPSVFLRLLMDNKPVVGALAFTGRAPITPVIYTFNNSFRHDEAGIHADIHPVMDYKRDALQQVDAIGFGVVMIQAGVFRSIPKPWFNSPGVGEDILFCIRCRQFGIPVWVDTRAKTEHKPTFPASWHNEEAYNLRLVSPDGEFGRLTANLFIKNQTEGTPILEGSCTMAELENLRFQARSAKTVCEVGFNAGFSALAFLSANPELKLVSFDIGEHPCVPTGKEYIDRVFPGRHTLILGDSAVTIPKYLQDHPDARFDISFIDGGHEYEEAKADLDNLIPVSKVLIMDDVDAARGEGIGPARAWSEAVTAGRVTHTGLMRSSEGGDRAWAIGDSKEVQP